MELSQEAPAVRSEDPRSNHTSHVRTGNQSLSHRRVFAAPAELVQRAHVDPELFRQWMGPRGSMVSFEQFNPVTGGAFRYGVGMEGTPAAVFFGSYHVVVPGLIVHTWQYHGETGFTVEALRFTAESHSSSVLDVTSTFPTVEACDQMVESGLDDEMDANFDRLDEVLSSLGRSVSS
nr:SRPBCC domain-containing protein [Microbacterium endophyticum]